MTTPAVVGAIASAVKAHVALTFVAAGTKAGTTAGTSVTPGLPAGLAQNDYMLMAASNFKSGATPGLTTPAGWTQLAFKDTSAGWGIDSYLYGKLAGASESAPSVASVGAVSSFIEAQIWAYRGANVTTPVDATAVIGASSTTTPVTQPNIITVTNNAMVSYAGYSQAAGTWQTVAGQTRRLDGTAGGNIMVLGVTDKTQATAGTVTGTTWQQASGNLLVIVVALRPS